MKNKPQRHKKSNTHKFIGFHEEVKSIRITNLRKPTFDHEGTFLWQRILTFKEDYRETLFREFQTALGIEIQTLPQLLHHESSIANTFKIYLEKAILDNDVNARIPIIHSLVAFAGDTGIVFYEKHFYDFLSILIRLITENVKCLKTLKNVFACLEELFRINITQLEKEFYNLYIKNEFCILFGKRFPRYVKNFAAQSLGQLVRTISKEFFFSLCMKRVAKHDDEVEGVACLLFQPLKSETSRRLHSSAFSIFKSYLDAVDDGRSKWEHAEKAIFSCLKHLMIHVTSQSNVPDPWSVSWAKDSYMIWDNLFNKLNDLCSKLNVEDESSLIFILEIIFNISDFKHAELVTDVRKVFTILTSVLKLKLSDEAGSWVGKIVANLVCSSQYNDSSLSELQDLLSKYIFEASFSSFIIYNFIDLVVTSSVFDEEILPLFLRFVVSTLNKKESEDTESDIIESLFKIINTNVSPVRTMEDMELWTKYELNFVSFDEDTKICSKKLLSSLVDSILSKGLASDLSNIEIIIKCCVCLPHISSLEFKNFLPHLSEILNDTFEMIQTEPGPKAIFKEDNESPKKKKKKLVLQSSSKLNQNINVEIKEDRRKLTFLLSVVIETLYHVISHTDFVTALSLREMKLVSILRERVQYRENVHLLKSLDIQLSVLAMEEDDLVSEETLADIYPILAPSLASHKPLARLLVSHIFTLFPYERIPSNLAESQLFNMFSVMFEVEAATFSPLNCKERLRLLSRLDVSNVNLSRPTSELLQQAPVLFLIGQLYINFKDMWLPVLNTIKEYSDALPMHTFWALWVDKLRVASHYALRRLCDKDVEEEDSTSFNDSSVSDYHKELISHPGFAHLNTKPDYRKFRDLLWRAMQQFSVICERNHKDVVTLFLKFLHEEFFPVDYDVAPTQDISIREKEKDEAEERERKEDVQEEESNEEEETLENNTEINLNQRVRKAPKESLFEYLKVFSKFHNPKVITKTKELEEIFCQFLSHPDVKARKLALDAIMSYRHKFLMPYKESLYNILDDNFKDETVLFNIEGKGVDEAKSLKEEHRTKFMPYLIRILYGKMSKTKEMRNSVYRYLAGANDSELDTFFNLSFDIFVSDINGTALNVVERVEETVDPKKVPPLNRMQGALLTLDSLFDKIGSLLVNKRPFLLKIILHILSTTVTLLDKRSDVFCHYLPSLKKIRQTAMKMVMMFFKKFETYKWSNDELEAIFRASIWPSLPKLPYEGIYSPTPLLMLFECWSSNASFHVLLSRHQKDNVSLTPMPFIIKLINHPKCRPAVVSFVYDLIQKLLKGRPVLPVDDVGDDVEMEEEFEPFELPLECILPLDQQSKKLGLLNLTWGEYVIFSCLDDLLVNIKNSLAVLKNNETINKRELTTLIHIAQWITNERDGKELLASVVPLLRKNCVKQNETVVYLLEVCKKLIHIVKDDSAIYTNDFICMFSVLNERSCRLALCDVIKTLYQFDDGEFVAKWCYELNAYNGKMVDEVDAETRLKCFREITEYLKQTSCLNEQLVLFLIHQNIWVLNQAGNEGLSDLSVLCLQILLETLVRVESDSAAMAKKVLDIHLLPLLKLGLKNDKETTRNAMMSVLGTVVHKCHQYHRRLKDLFLLADPLDPEADFFTNMHHLQRSRRAKSLSKVAAGLTEGNLTLQTETITEFILPATSVYLFKDEYASDGNLITSCVTCIGALASQLPWYHYHNLLKYYLNLIPRELKHLKLGVRVLEVVLDAFHENVSEFEPSEMIGEKSENKVEDLEKFDDLEDESNQSVSKTSKTEKIYWALTKYFIPRLEKVLSERSVRDTEHKANKKKYPEEDDIKRIPLAFALVKLLKRLPKKVLKWHIKSVLMKLIDYLKSRLESIRKGAREMLVKVMKELGGEYLSCMVFDMKEILSRGYQTHVLIYTLHAILVALKGLLTAHHIAPCVVDIMEICVEDIFGDKAEEKLVGEITKKVKEAKVERGYAIMGLISQVIPVDQVENIMTPLKEKLQTTDSKVVNKVAACLQKIGLGLESNPNISIEHKSLFVYTILKEKVSSLSEGIAPKEPQPKRPVRVDCFLIEPEPRRVGLVPKISRTSTLHVLIEFALRLLSNLMKYNIFETTNAKHCSFLDGYVEIISNCLLSEYPEVSVQALHVISRLIKYPLPSLKENMAKIFGKMFVILNKFSSTEMTKNKLFQLVQLDLKVIALIIEEVTYLEIQDDHAKLLINYAEINLNNVNQYHSSFIILNAFVNRKLSYDQLYQIMSNLKNQSILSTNLNMLDQARKTYLNYFFNCNKKRKQYIDVLYFYVGNLSYEIECGRKSAHLTVQELISKDVSTKLDHKTELNIFFAISDRLLRETEKELKVLIRKILKTFYAKSCRKNVLMDECLKDLKIDLMKKNSVNAISIHSGLQSLMPMIDVENQDQTLSIFEKVLPKIVELIHPNRFLEGEDSDNTSAEGQCLDASLKSLLEMLLLIVEFHFNNQSLASWAEKVDSDLWKHVQHHLLYPNLNIRFTSARIFDKLLFSCPVTEKSVPVIAANVDMVESLVSDCCEQLVISNCSILSPMLTELGLAVVRNLLYLINHGRRVPIEIRSENPDAEVPFRRKTERKPEANPVFEGAHRVLEMVGMIAYDELKVEGTQVTFRRECFLNLIGGVVRLLKEELDMAPNIVSFIVRHLTRELSDKSLPEQYLNRTKEYVEFMKEHVGIQRYNEIAIRAQVKMDKKRNKRKARVREKFISDPEFAMKKKAKKHLDKKESKKRKYAEYKLQPNKKRKTNVL